VHLPRSGRPWPGCSTAALVLMALFAEQKLEGLKRRHPGIPLELISAAIGLTSLFLGLALTALFIWVIVIL